jgi:hypothetical protein
MEFMWDVCFNHYIISDFVLIKVVDREIIDYNLKPIFIPRNDLLQMIFISWINYWVNYSRSDVRCMQIIPLKDQSTFGEFYSWGCIQACQTSCQSSLTVAWFSIKSCVYWNDWSYCNKFYASRRIKFYASWPIVSINTILLKIRQS